MHWYAIAMAAASEAPKFDVFLSYNARDSEASDRIAQYIRESHLEPFFAKWHLAPGQPWPEALRLYLDTCQSVVVVAGPGGLSSWQHREAIYALERQKREAGFPVIPVLLRGADPLVLGFLGQNTWVDLRAGDDELPRLTGAIRKRLPAENSAKLLGAVCPYKGLAYFREEDAPFYFGRTSSVSAVLAELDRTHFLAIAGASGSGKSSLVRAGVAAALRRSSTVAWEIAALVPSFEPLCSLAAPFVQLLHSDRDEIDRIAATRKTAGMLASGEIRLRDLSAEVVRKQHGTERFLLVVDQWEELYTLCKDSSHCQCFIDEILDAVQHGALTAVVTIRADFLGRVLDYRPLCDYLRNRQYNVGPMTPDELKEVILLPAAKVDCIVEESLLNRLLHDVATEPGHLPLLEFVLRALWETRDHGRFSLATYDSIGGLRGALTRHANAVYGSLSETEKSIARKVFLRVVRPGDAGQDTRRRAFKREFSGDDWQVVTKLADKRLLVTTRQLENTDSLGADSVEVSHEILIRHWPVLSAWLNEDRELLHWRERFRNHFDEWRADKNDNSRLLAGSLLVEAERWLSERPEALSADEQEFVEHSSKTAQGLLLAEQRRLESERDAAKRLAEEQSRAANRLRGGLLAVATGLALCGYFFWQAQRQRTIANDAREKAEVIVTYLAFDLRQKLTPYVPLEIQSEINDKVDDYFHSVGSGTVQSQLHLEAASLMNRGDALLSEGKLAEASASFEKARNILKRLAGQDPRTMQWQRDLSVSNNKLGDVNLRQRRFAEARKAYDESFEIRQKLSDVDPSNSKLQRDLFVSHQNIGTVKLRQDDFEGALMSYRAALAIAQRLADQDRDDRNKQADLAVGLENVGDVQARTNDLGGALASYKASFVIKSRLAREDPQNVKWQSALSLINCEIGDVYRLQKELQLTLTSYQACLEIGNQIMQRDPKNVDRQRAVANSYSRIADAQRDLRMWDQAVTSLRSSLSIRGALYKQDTENVDIQRELAATYYQIGEIYFAQKNWNQAITQYDAALGLRKKLADKDISAEAEVELYAVYAKDGASHINSGGLSQAAELIDASMKTADRLVQQEPKNLEFRHYLFVSEWNFASILMKLGRNLEALSFVERSIRTGEALLRMDSTDPELSKNIEQAKSLAAQLRQRKN